MRGASKQQRVTVGQGQDTQRLRASSVHQESEQRQQFHQRAGVVSFSRRRRRRRSSSSSDPRQASSQKGQKNQQRQRQRKSDETSNDVENSPATARLSRKRLARPATMAGQQEAPVYHPQDALKRAINTTMVTGGVGLFTSAVQNTLQKQNVGPWGIFTRSGSTIFLFGTLILLMCLPLDDELMQNTPGKE